MEDTDPDLIDEICGQDENDQDQEGEGGGRVAKACRPCGPVGADFYAFCNYGQWMGRCLGAR